LVFLQPTNSLENRRMIGLSTWTLAETNVSSYAGPTTIVISVATLNILYNAEPSSIEQSHRNPEQEPKYMCSTQLPISSTVGMLPRHTTSHHTSKPELNEMGFSRYTPTTSHQ
jgi:hypothetical protein